MTPATLDEIGLKHGTDKASSHHHYLSFYESFLAPLRESAITLLEIGVYKGASLATWRDYFPFARIVGVDILPSAKQYEGERVRVELADQGNLEHLAEIAVAHGPFDLIIEDGSHMWEHQTTTLRALFPFLRNGGHYIVEDLQTNYGALEASYRGLASRSCMDFLKSWLDLHVAGEALDRAGIEDPFLRSYGRAIEHMTFHRHACVIRKRFAGTDWRVSRGPSLAPQPPDRINVMLTAHFGIRGDILGPQGYVDEGADRFTIQGLQMETEIGALEFRVRFPDGSWSVWTPEGGFAGTRGQSRPITGVSVRAAERYLVELRGLFVGGVAVDVRGGEACVAPSGAELRGLQVTLRPAVPSLEADLAEP